MNDLITTDTPHEQLVREVPKTYFEGTISEQQLTDRELCALLVLCNPGPSALRQEALRRIQDPKKNKG